MDFTYSAPDDRPEESGERDDALGQTVGEADDVWRGHGVLMSAGSRRGRTIKTMTEVYASVPPQKRTALRDQ